MATEHELVLFCSLVVLITNSNNIICGISTFDKLAVAFTR